MDIRPYEASAEEFERFIREFRKEARPEVGERFGIPYSILASKGCLNLWVAGRCHSACDLDTQELIETLREKGAYLPQNTSSKTMTRQ